MAKSKISDDILQMIKKKSGDEKVILHFLQEILYEEADNVGKQWWHFKERYKQLTEKYIKEVE